MSASGRMRDLYALTTEHLPDDPERVMLAVVCNGCGAQVSVEGASYTEAERSFLGLTAGWRITPRPEDADLCPSCLAEGKQTR